jgi:hypothetical protein
MRPAALALPLLVALPAAAAISSPNVPPRLQAGPAEVAAFSLRGEGVHVYECKPGFDGRLTWVFSNPEVNFSDGATTVATQNQVNFWESTSDRSSVSTIVRASAAAGSDNLPWTLYAAQSNDTGGRFGGVTSVQRVNTVGGVAPSTGCSDTTAGTEVRVPFRADYYFYKRRGTA